MRLDTLEIYDEIKKEHPGLTPDEAIQLTKLTVYNMISENWLDLIEEIRETI